MERKADRPAQSCCSCRLAWIPSRGSVGSHVMIPRAHLALAASANARRRCLRPRACPVAINHAPRWRTASADSSLGRSSESGWCPTSARLHRRAFAAWYQPKIAAEAEASDSVDAGQQDHSLVSNPQKNHSRDPIAVADHLLELSNRLIEARYHSEWGSILAQSGHRMDSLLKQWNVSLKRLSGRGNQLSPEPYVVAVDKLVHTMLRSGASPSDEMYATYVAIVGWSRVASSDAPVKAEALFHKLDFRFDGTLDVTWSLVRERRNLYLSLLTTWNRSGREDAAERALIKLQEMKREELENSLKQLVDVQCYNRVMACFADLGDVKTVRQLWAEMEDRGLEPEAVSYDCLIKAYQNGSSGADDAYAAYRELLEKFTHARPRHSEKARRLRPHATALSWILQMSAPQPQRALEILEHAFEYERQLRMDGLVSGPCVYPVLNGLGRAGMLDEAENLLTDVVSRIEAGHTLLRRVNVKWFGVVMTACSHQHHDPDLQLRRVDLLYDLLIARVRSGANVFNLDQVIFNTYMSCYLRLRDDPVPKIEVTLGVMEDLSQRLGRQDLLPDEVSYSILMKALMKRGGSGVAKQVEAVLQKMKAVNLRPNYASLMDFWAQSNNPDAILHTKSLLEAVAEPDTQLFNAAIKVCTKLGSLKDAMQFFERMSAECDLVQDCICCPNRYTYLLLIQALENSANSNRRWEDAADLFRNMMKRYNDGQGDIYCKPETQLVMTLFRVLVSSQTRNPKHREAQKIMQMLSRAHVGQTPGTLAAFIDACASSLGDEVELKVAFEAAAEALSNYSSLATPSVYCSMIRACRNLLLDAEDRDKHIRELFRHCADSGKVSKRVLETLWGICSADTYLLLTLQNADHFPNSDAIPDEWKRNVH